MSEKNVPNIRFKGFTEDWEQRKLGEFSQSYSGGTPSISKKSYYGGSIPFIRSAEISATSTELHLTSEGLKNSSAKMVKVGDILYALYGATSGEVGISKMNGAINQAILTIQTDNDNDAEFVMQWLKKQKLKITGKYLQGGQGNLSGKIVKNLLIIKPSDKIEQKGISRLLHYLDQLIASNQRKLDQLKEVKKLLMQKIFDQEWRFKGFTDPWEQRKLGEFSQSYSGGTPSISKKSYYGGSIPFIRSAEISATSTELHLTSEGLKNSSAKMVKVGDILYALYGATSGEVGISKMNGAINQAILTIQTDNDNDAEFVMQWLKKQKLKITGKYLQGGQGNLSGKIVKNLLIIKPSDKIEQKGISRLLHYLDQLIASNQQKLDQLKEMKKWFMQNMFV